MPENGIRGERQISDRRISISIHRNWIERNYWFNDVNDSIQCIKATNASAIAKLGFANMCLETTDEIQFRVHVKSNN